MKNDSKCPRNKYCGFDVVYSQNRLQAERCRYCHKLVAYKLSAKNDACDSLKYRRDHVRDTAQPGGPTNRIFYEIYGKKPKQDLDNYLRVREKSKRDREDFDWVFKQEARWATSSAMNF